MMTLLKILTLPIWLPLKILWGISKIIAFVFLCIILIVVFVILFHL